MTLRIAVPNKGRLNERTMEILTKTGIDLGENWGRKLLVKVKNPDLEIIFVRAQDIPEFVKKGSVDIGITGQDQVANSGYKLKEIFQLKFGYCRLCIAAPEDSKIKSLKDIKKGCKVATSFPLIASQYFKANKKDVEIITISGAAEIMPYLGISDVIVDLVSTGSTLKTNRLVEIGQILESQAVIVANDVSLKQKREQIDNLLLSINSILYAETKLFLVADVPAKSMPKINKLFPGVAGPTVLNISGRDDMLAIQVIIDKDDVLKSVNELRKLGAEGILTLPMERLVA